MIGHVVAASPLAMAAGLDMGAVTQRPYAPLGIVVIWALALLITGAGIGMAWPHLAVRAMTAVDDPAESSAAAAAINIIQLSSGAFGAGPAGVVVNTAPA
ncbi:MAG: MFS transporter, partial [Mycobacteriaceae bacterium]|nr:MFS transporter [Mycobacteriaceae bacterium]